MIRVLRVVLVVVLLAFTVIGFGAPFVGAHRLGGE